MESGIIFLCYTAIVVSIHDDNEALHRLSPHVYVAITHALRPSAEGTRWRGAPKSFTIQPPARIHNPNYYVHTPPGIYDICCALSL